MATRIVEGLDGVRQALREVPKETRGVLRDVVRVTTRIVTQRTKQNAPFETGALREAIAESQPKGSSLNGGVQILPGEFRGRVPSSYVLALEYGKGPGARPFVRSTSEAESGPYVSRLIASGKTIERNLENFGGRFV
jgi:hypothetical protein